MSLCTTGALVSPLDAALIADRPMPEIPEQHPLLIGSTGGRDVAWFGVSAWDDQGNLPTCTVQSCLDLVEIAWRLKGVAVPNLRGTTAYYAARQKYHAQDGSTGGLFQEEAFWGALQTGLFPGGTRWERVEGEESEAAAMGRLPLIDVEAVTEGWQPQHVNRANGYFDATAHPAIQGYHSSVRLAMLFAGENCWHAKHIHWGRGFGVQGVVLYHRACYLKYRSRDSAYALRFPDRYWQHDGWRLHIS